MEKIKIDNMIISEYSDKSLAIQGDTKPYKEIIKKTGGKFNPYLIGGIGWIISKKKKDVIIRRLKLEYEKRNNK